MLVIRRDQMAALADRSRLDFVDEMTAHLCAHAPRLAELRGEACMRQVVQLGVVRAVGYGLTLRGPIRLYLELMLALGCDFDTDPQHAWARTILRDDAGMAQMARADHLFTVVRSYFDRVVGPGSAFALRALQRVRERDLSQLVGEAGLPLERRIDSALREIYPEKSHFVGEAAVAHLIDDGTRLAERMGVGGERGTGLLVALMYGFGHGVVDDPLYPWVRHTLQRSDPARARLDRLVAKTLHYVSGMLAHLDPAA